MILQVVHAYPHNEGEAIAFARSWQLPAECSVDDLVAVRTAFTAGEVIAITSESRIGSILYLVPEDELLDESESG